MNGDDFLDGQSIAFVQRQAEAIADDIPLTFDAMADVDPLAVQKGVGTCRFSDLDVRLIGARGKKDDIIFQMLGAEEVEMLLAQAPVAGDAVIDHAAVQARADVDAA